MAPSKRPASQGAQLAADSTQEEVLEWMVEGAGIPRKTVQKLADTWEANGELIDGRMVLEADQALLERIGCAVTVAHRMVQAARANASVSATQPAGEPAQQQQQQQQQQQPAARQPLAEVQPSQQEQQPAARQPLAEVQPSQQEQQPAARQPLAEVQPSQEPQQPRQQQQQPRQQQQQPRQQQQVQVQVKPDPDEWEAQLVAAAAARRQPQQQPQQQQAEAEPEARQCGHCGSLRAGPTASYVWRRHPDTNQRLCNPCRKHWDECRRLPPLGGEGDEDAAMADDEEEAAAEEEHQASEQQADGEAAQLLLSGGPAGRRGRGRASAAADGGDDLPQMLTRRQRAQVEARHTRQRRTGRLSTAMTAAQRSAMAAAAEEDGAEQEQEQGAEEAEAQEEEEEEGEEEEGAQRPQRQQRRQAAAEPVLEDLGPEAPRGFHVRDWRKACRRDLLEIIGSFMTAAEIKEAVEEQMDTWPEQVLESLQAWKKRAGVRRLTDLRPPQMARNIVNYIFTGCVDGKVDREGGGGMCKDDIQALLREFCDAPLRRWVKEVLKKRYQNLPATTDSHRLAWKCWHLPLGPLERPEQVLLGIKTIQYEAIIGCNADLEPPNNSTFSRWSAVMAGLRARQLRLVDHVRAFQSLVDLHMPWFEEVDRLSAQLRFQPRTRVVRDPSNRVLKVHLYQIFTQGWDRELDKPDNTKGDVSSSRLSGVWVARDAPAQQQGQGPAAAGQDGPQLQVVDLHRIFEGLDGVQGSPFLAQMDRLMAEYRRSEQQVCAKGVARELPPEAPLNLDQGRERREDDGFEQLCDDEFLLKLKPYQRRSLAHVLREERAQGGSSRHLWVKYGLPEHPEVRCYVSPVLREVRCFTSRIEAEQAVGACGGCGWVALEMGMGKTAVAIGAIQLNPPPEGWRANRAYQSARVRDHLSAYANNLPHGGTLVVAPPTLIDQWEDEIRKTTDEPLTIIKWTESRKGHERPLSCREIASYDVVLTTPALYTQHRTLSHVRWWRAICDEPQLAAGGFLADREHLLLASHRWLLTGTPTNATVETMSPSFEFLKLGSFGECYRFLPPVTTHVLKELLVRYNKAGQIEGRTNLELPPIQQRVVECQLSDEDSGWYRRLREEKRSLYAHLLGQCGIDPDSLGEDDMAYEYKKPEVYKKQRMAKLRGAIGQLRQAASSALKQPTGEEHYDSGTGRYIKEKYWYQSKAEEVIKVLQGKDPEEKVLVFSEFPDTLRAIKTRLPSIGLQYRDLIGSSNAAARGKAIRAFQDDPPTKVFLLSHRAGGAGITLTKGTHIILCEPTLNPSFERQAIGRSHRMGQDRPITVTRMLCKGTIEEQVKAFVDRQVAAEAAPEGGHHPASTAAEANPASNDETNKLTIEDLRDMLNCAEELGEVGFDADEQDAAYYSA